MKEEIFNRSIEEHRQIVSALKPILAPADVPYNEGNYVTVYRPKGINEPFPTLLYIPGNAFVASETGYTHYICSHLAAISHCQIIVIKHRLAPEFQFPIGLQDAYKIISLLLNIADRNLFNIDRTRVAVAGYSSGGNFAALISIFSKFHKLPIARQILISPITDLSRSLKGFEKYQKQDTAVSEQFVKWFSELYIPKHIKPTHPKLSPYWTKSENLKELPITDILFGELDRFRGDSELYGKRLIKQGNLVNYFRFKNENHGLLWHNMQIIKTVAARLLLSFGTDPIERLLPIEDRIQILKLRHNDVVQESKRKKHRTLKFFGPSQW